MGGPCPRDLAIEQVRWTHVAKRVEHDRANMRMVALELREQVRHRVALEPLLRATQVAWDDREGLLCGERGDLGLGTLDERPDHLEAAVVGAIARRHRLELAAVEQIEQEGLERIVAVMAERDLVAPEALGGGVED